MNHDPKYKYDCENCKYSWCCGPVCLCVLRNKDYDLIETPTYRKIEVNEALIKEGLKIEFDDVSKESHIEYLDEDEINKEDDEFNKVAMIERCPLCDTEWEDWKAVSCCPCRDE